MGVVFSGWCSFSLQFPSSEKKPLHLHKHPCLPTNPSMIFCTPRAATRITASLFYSLPEPWRMDGVVSGWHHHFPAGTGCSDGPLQNRCKHQSLCLQPPPYSSPSPPLTSNPQAVPEELFPATPPAEARRRVCSLGKKPYASFLFWKVPSVSKNEFSSRCPLTLLALRKRTCLLSSPSGVSLGLEGLWADSVAPPSAAQAGEG